MPHTNVESPESNTPEPVETFLASVVCVDRLAMYIDTIELLKAMQKGSMVEQLNLAIFDNDDLSPSEVTDVVHQKMLGLVRSLLADFNVMTEGGSLPFLVKLAHVLNLIDAWDEPEHVINVATHAMGEPKHKLFAIVNIIQDFDDEEYYQVVTMVAQSLIEKIIDIHSTRLEELENAQLAIDMEVAEVIDFTILRKVVKENRQLAITEMFEDGLISNVLPTEQLISIAAPYIDKREIVDPKAMSAELIGVFLVTGFTGDKLINEIKNHLPEVISDDLLIARVNVVLSNVYMELIA